jgi:cytochrome oxidase Cu insertion factor (SCO1/SenC/PrrC family)
MRNAWACGLLLAGLAAGAAGAQKDVKFYGSAEERKKTDALHGKPAFELEDLQWVQGGPLKLADLRGKVVLLDFWAQW